MKKLLTVMNVGQRVPAVQTSSTYVNTQNIVKQEITLILGRKRGGRRSLRHADPQHRDRGHFQSPLREADIIQVAHIVVKVSVMTDVVFQHYLMLKCY